jgi:hypothetical protein
MKKPFTIQVSYDAHKDDGKTFRARALLHVDAMDMRDAYRVAENSGMTGNPKFGAIIPGHHAGRNL